MSGGSNLSLLTALRSAGVEFHLKGFVGVYTHVQCSSGYSRLILEFYGCSWLCLL